MRIDMPLFKIVERPLLPVAGSWVDATPFVALFAVLVLAHVLLRHAPASRVQWLRRLSQLFATFLLVIFLHRCLCVLRGWVFALKLVGRNDVLAFGNLCLFVLFVAATLSLGRVFCGWACPMGFFQEILAWFAARRERLARRTRLAAGYLLLTGICIVIFWLAYLVRPGTQYFSENVAAVWGAWLLLLLFFALPVVPHDAGLRRTRYVSLAFWLFLSVVGVFVTDPWCTLFGNEVDYSSIVALLSVLLAGAVVSMAWCRYLCPLGSVLGWLTRYAPLRLVNRHPCFGCGKCGPVCPVNALNRGRIDQSSCLYCGKCIGVCGYAWEMTPDTRVIRAGDDTGATASGPTPPPARTPAGPARPPPAHLRELLRSPGLSSALQAEARHELQPVARDAAQHARADTRGGVPSREYSPAGDRGGLFATTCVPFLGLLALTAPAITPPAQAAEPTAVRTPPSAPDPGAWPVFHANLARTGRSEVLFRHPPFARTWTFDLGQHTWRYCQGASVWSACAVSGSVDGAMRIFVGAYDHNLYCLDTSDGRQLWRFTTGCLVNAAPAFAVVEGQPMVFVASSDRTFYAVNARTGAKAWSHETYPWTYTVGESHAGSPLVAELDGRQVLFATMWNADRRPLRTVQTGECFAFDAATGDIRWRRCISSSPLTAPTYLQDHAPPALVIGSEDGTLYAVDARNGEPLWHFTGDHRIVATPVIVRHDGQPTIIAANGFGMVRCLSARAGDLIWRYKAGHEVLSTPAFVTANGKPILLAGAGDRCIHAIHAKTGELLWKFQTGKYVVASPAVASIRGRPAVFVNSMDNALYCLDAETGCEIMRFESGDMLWPYETRGTCLWASPSVLQAGPDTALLLYPAHDGKLYAFADTRPGEAQPGDAVLSAWTAPRPNGPEFGRERRPGKALFYVPPVAGAVLMLAGIALTLRGRAEC